MPNLNSILKGIVAGNSFKVVREIRNIPSGDTLVKAWFTVKDGKEDTDANAIFQKMVTLAESDDGQILDSGADTIGTVSIKLKPSDTIKLKQYTTYVFDLKLLTANGDQYTPELGTLTVEDPVTLAGSGNVSMMVSTGGVTAKG